jgi:hypothetical protein
MTFTTYDWGDRTNTIRMGRERRVHSPGDAFIQTSVKKQCRKGAVTWENGRDENTL